MAQPLPVIIFSNLGEADALREGRQINEFDFELHLEKATNLPLLNPCYKKEIYLGDRTRKEKTNTAKKRTCQMNI